MKQFIKLIMIIMLIPLGLTGCAVEGHVSGDITVTHRLDLTYLYETFYKACRAENPTYTPEQLDDCANERLTRLLEELENLK